MTERQKCILARATSLFGSQEAADRWLCSPVMALGHRRPVDLLETEEGMEMLEDLLTQLEYGVYV